MITPTADLCDQFGETLRVLEPGLASFGGVSAFGGRVATLRVLEDNGLVRAALESPGVGRVLVVDGHASLRCALLGGNLGRLAERNGWAGVVVWGAVRDVTELQRCRIGVRALASCPRRPARDGAGERDLRVLVAGVTISPGDWLVADADGIVVLSPSAAGSPPA